MGKSKKGLVNTRQKTSLQLDYSKKSDTKRGKELHVLLVVPIAVISDLSFRSQVSHSLKLVSLLVLSV